MPETMLTKRSHGEGETEDPSEADQALTMGTAVTIAFEEHGGDLRGVCREVFAQNLAGIIQPLLSTCTNAEWIEAINARLHLLEAGVGEPGPRLARFGANGAAEMTAPGR